MGLGERERERERENIQGNFDYLLIGRALNSRKTPTMSNIGNLHMNSNSACNL